MTDRQTIRESFEAAWDRRIKCFDGFTLMSACQLWFVAWKTCEEGPQRSDDAFESAWLVLTAVSWTCGIEKEYANNLWCEAWRTCEARQEYQDSAGALRIVPAASP
jgi:hypothetical protein